MRVFASASLPVFVGPSFPHRHARASMGRALCRKATIAPEAARGTAMQTSRQARAKQRGSERRSPIRQRRNGGHSSESSRSGRWALRTYSWRRGVPAEQRAAFAVQEPWSVARTVCVVVRSVEGAGTAAERWRNSSWRAPRTTVRHARALRLPSSSVVRRTEARLSDV